MKNIIFIITVLLAMAFLSTASAKPYLPKDDAEVLERLSVNLASRELRALRTKLTQNPSDLTLALNLAHRYIKQGRAESDPRYYGYAESALSPWWGLPAPPVEALILRATIRQSVHNFDGALSDLSLALKADPNNPQAWLTRAVIHQVRGDYNAAKQSCLPLLKLTTRLVATTCITEVGSLNGQAEQSYTLLKKTLDLSSDASTDERLWVLTALAEMAVRMGKTDIAEGHFKQALALKQTDHYLMGAYADFLLDANRPNEVIALLSDKTRIDGLLMRLVLAEKMIRSPNLSDHTQILRARFEAARLRADARHIREEARFTLALLNQPQEALKLAKENWAVQREPADVRILLEAAQATDDSITEKEVFTWIQKTGLEDAQIMGLKK